jgi:hypothetical protein
MEARSLQRRTQKTAARLFLALALLVAQSGAQIHAYSHLRPGSNPSDLAGTSSRLCGDCLSFAPLLSAAGASDASFVAATVKVAALLCTSIAPRVEERRHHAFRSRAPPHLL